MTKGYFKSAGKFKVLKDSQQKELLLRYKAGDMLALKQLAEGNLRFVVMTANKYRNMGVEFDDLINAGNLGLMKGLKHFDLKFDNRVSTYIIQWIRQGIFMELANMSRTVRLPYNKYCDYVNLSKKEDVSDVEIVELVNSKVTSCIDDNETAILSDVEERVEKEETLKQLMDKLTTEEKIVIILTFGLDHRECMTIDDVAKKLKMTRKNAKKLKFGAMKRMRKESLKLV